MNLRLDKLIWIYGLYPTDGWHGSMRMARLNKWTMSIDLFDSETCTWKHVPDGKSYLFDDLRLSP